MIPRRQFITGLLCAPAIVRVASLDALARGVPLNSSHFDTWQRLGPEVDFIPLYVTIEMSKIMTATYPMRIIPITVSGWMTERIELQAG